MGGNGLGDVGVVGDQFQVCPLVYERRRLVELRRHDADGVGDVGDAVAEEVLGFIEGRDGDAAEIAVYRQPGDVGGFGGLHVRAQADAQRLDALGHRLGVAGEAGPIEDQGWGRKVIEVHGPDSRYFPSLAQEPVFPILRPLFRAPR